MGPKLAPGHAHFASLGWTDPEVVAATSAAPKPSSPACRDGSPKRCNGEAALQGLRVEAAQFLHRFEEMGLVEPLRRWFDNRETITASPDVYSLPPADQFINLQLPHAWNDPTSLADFTQDLASARFKGLPDWDQLTLKARVWLVFLGLLDTLQCGLFLRVKSVAQPIVEGRDVAALIHPELLKALFEKLRYAFALCDLVVQLGLPEKPGSFATLAGFCLTDTMLKGQINESNAAEFKDLLGGTNAICQLRLLKALSCTEADEFEIEGIDSSSSQPPAPKFTFLCNHSQ